ncbi:MAG TPA: hypothetical protein PKA62_03430, partial [Thermoanaerobaculia bacterium]|nr:hypothetical protein [Thermoanaerobaculia bacterium]
PPTGITYYYTAMDAYRTDDISRLDLSLNYSYFIGPVEIFAQPTVINLFGQDNVVTPYTSIENPQTHSAYYKTFNPFTTKPVFGARGTNANWGVNQNLFGKADGPEDFQTPRTFRVSFGVRF